MSRDHKLVFVGSPTQREFRGGGIDGGKDYHINCKQNDTIYVTEDKKSELLKDHPEWFVDIQDDAPEKPQQLRQKPILPANESGANWEEPTDKVTPIDYSKKNMKELRKIAKDKKIKVQFGTTKAALIQMIESKK